MEHPVYWDVCVALFNEDVKKQRIADIRMTALTPDYINGFSGLLSSNAGVWIRYSLLKVFNLCGDGFWKSSFPKDLSQSTTSAGQAERDSWFTSRLVAGCCIYGGDVGDRILLSTSHWSQMPQLRISSEIMSKGRHKTASKELEAVRYQSYI